MKKLIVVLLFAFSLCADAQKDKDITVKITNNLPNVLVESNGQKITIMRIQDIDNILMQGWKLLGLTTIVHKEIMK